MYAEKKTAFTTATSRSLETSLAWICATSRLGIEAWDWM
jgi:hypothetical protein